MRLQRIVADLLTLSRLETHERVEGLEVIDVGDVLDRIADSARSLSAGSKHDIRVECESGIGLWGNPSEIESAFSNLVFNAVRYTPDGGQIVLKWWRRGDESYFAVTDTGVGIEAQHIPRLTERFYRVDVGRSREEGGTGLGLAIVKHVLIRHNARLKIDSQPGVGSSFTCCFPADRTRTLSVAELGDRSASGA